MTPRPLAERAGELIRARVAARELPADPQLRNQLVRAAQQRPRRNLATPISVALLAVLAIVGAVLLLRPAEPARPLTFVVGPAAAPGEIGTYFAPVGGGQLPLRFSDGSTVTLTGQARGRVARTAVGGAAVVLETGRVEVAVVHRPGADWTIAAGPYSIQVTGTEFAATWDAGAGELEVAMRSGKVVVRGPGLPSGVEVSGTQRFTTRSTSRLEQAPPDASATGAEAAPTAGANLPDGSPASEPSGALVREFPTPSASAGPASWSTLAAHGEYRSILQDADRRGVDAALDGAGAAELATLADAARYTGRGDLARRALLALRARFAGSGRAASAAFLLGRMADDGGSPAAAVQWYDHYLSEAPGGSLAPEALGRRMVALKRAGSSETARKAAEDYLRRFPAGSYAGVASEMAQP